MIRFFTKFRKDLLISIEETKNQKIYKYKFFERSTRNSFAIDGLNTTVIYNNVTNNLHSFPSQFDGASPRFRLLLDGSLQIINIYQTDSGIYLCVADNGIGRPVQREISLNVTGKDIYLIWYCYVW